jgi:LPXTG-motif cell wall-anchored protein
VDEPAVADENGVNYIPKHTSNTLAFAIAGITAVAVISFFLFRKKSKPGIPWREFSTGSLKPSQLKKGVEQLGQQGMKRFTKEKRNLEKLGKEIGSRFLVPGS